MHTHLQWCINSLRFYTPSPFVCAWVNPESPITCCKDINYIETKPMEQLPTSWGGQTNPYNGSLLDDCNPASKGPVYGLFWPNPNTTSELEPILGNYTNPPLLIPLETMQAPTPPKTARCPPFTLLINYGLLSQGWRFFINFLLRLWGWDGYRILNLTH